MTENTHIKFLGFTTDKTYNPIDTHIAGFLEFDAPVGIKYIIEHPSGFPKADFFDKRFSAETNQYIDKQLMDGKTYIFAFASDLEGLNNSDKSQEPPFTINDAIAYTNKPQNAQIKIIKGEKEVKLSIHPDEFMYIVFKGYPDVQVPEIQRAIITDVIKMVKEKYGIRLADFHEEIIQDNAKDKSTISWIEETIRRMPDKVILATVFWDENGYLIT